MTTLGSLLIANAQAWKEGVTTTLAPYGITFATYRLLDAIYFLQFNEGLLPSQKEAASLAVLDLNVVSQTMKYLMGHHLINREQNENDSRAYKLSLTLAGQQLARTTSAAVERFNQDFFSEVDSGVLRHELQTLLKR